MGGSCNGTAHERCRGSAAAPTATVPHSWLSLPTRRTASHLPPYLIVAAWPRIAALLNVRAVPICPCCSYHVAPQQPAAWTDRMRLRHQRQACWIYQMTSCCASWLTCRCSTGWAAGRRQHGCILGNHGRRTRLAALLLL